MNKFFANMTEHCQEWCVGEICRHSCTHKGTSKYQHKETVTQTNTARKNCRILPQARHAKIAKTLLIKSHQTNSTKS